MSKHTALQIKIYKELAKYQKTAEELSLLKDVSKDLKNYRKMLNHKKND